MAAMDLQLRDVRHRYGSRVILNIEALSLQAGKCTLLQGDNGSGKTTLMKILAGLIAPLNAECQIDNTWLRWRQARRRLIHQCVYLHQHVYVFDCSVTGNIDYALRIQGLNRQERQQRVADSLEWAGLDRLARQPAHTLSGGEKQRLALCRAKVLEPAFLLLDEPTANLDAQSRSRSMKLMQDLSASGTGILITSHHQDPAGYPCDTRWVLHDTHISVTGNDMNKRENVP